MKKIIIFITAIITLTLAINASAYITYHPDPDCETYVDSWEIADEFEIPRAVTLVDGSNYDQVAINVYGNVQLISVMFPIEFGGLTGITTPLTMFVTFIAEHAFDWEFDVYEQHQINLGNTFMQDTYTYNVSKLLWNPTNMGPLPTNYPRHYQGFSALLEIIGEPGVMYQIGTVRINDTRLAGQTLTCEN